eukprot:UN03879
MINYDSDSENELNENNESKDNSLINESILIGGYEKTKKLRARTIRKPPVSTPYMLRKAKCIKSAIISEKK